MRVVLGKSIGASTWVDRLKSAFGNRVLHNVATRSGAVRMFLTARNQNGLVL